ncbi:MAG: UTP--glucose-1-phosphate uridylyltransferase [Acidimicrobiia bacterium]
MNVEVAVVPAAGRGIRMRPATRVVPKALIPVVDRPAIQYAVEECVRAGAREVILIVDPGVGTLAERHFWEEGPLPGLENVTITPVVQEVPHGLGHAVLTARPEVADRPFLCVLADNIPRPGGDVLPGMAGAFDDTSVVCLRRLTPEFLERYGVIVPGAWRSEEVVEVRGAVEKPGAAHAPSDLGLIGRYLFTAEIFPILENLPAGVGGEIQLTDAISELGNAGRCLGYVASQDLLDIGNPLGLLQASTVLGLSHAEWGAEYRSYLAGLVDSL